MSHDAATTAPTPPSPYEPPAAVRAATAVLVVLAAVLAALTLLILLGGVVVVLTGPVADPSDGARQLGRAAAVVVGLGVPLALTVVTVLMVLAVRARRSWPSRALVVLVAVSALLIAGALVLVVWSVLGSGSSTVGSATTAFLLAPLVLVLALQAGAAVLLRRPSARAWSGAAG